VFAGFHYGALLRLTACEAPSAAREFKALTRWCAADLNWMTIHGKSRFPGLFIWLRDGRRVPVAVPDGCLLLQARAGSICDEETG
jgi:hypothetical protein